MPEFGQHLGLDASGWHDGAHARNRSGHAGRAEHRPQRERGGSRRQPTWWRTSPSPPRCSSAVGTAGCRPAACGTRRSSPRSTPSSPGGSWRHRHSQSGSFAASSTARSHLHVRNRGISRSAERRHLPARGPGPARVPRIRLGGDRRTRRLRASGSRSRRAGSETWSPSCPSGSSARSGSATPDGRRTARRPTSTPIRISTRPGGSPSFTTASSTTRRPCGRGCSTTASTLVSETDTELIAHLVGRSEAETLEDKVLEVLLQIEGTYGLAILHADFPDRIVAARNGSPLIIGIGDREMHLASDVSALVRYTTQVVHLDDGELATITSAGFSTFTADRLATHKSPTEVDLTSGSYDLGDHEHFMYKEILEQPAAAERVIQGSAQRALRHDAPRRTEPGRARDPRHQTDQDPRLRLGLLRRPARRRHDRGAGPRPRRRRGRIGVPLPQPGHRSRHAVRRHDPVRRDGGHPARRPGDQAQGRTGRRADQRRGLDHRTRVRRRDLPARGTRGVRRLDEGPDQHVDRLRAARRPARPGQGPVGGGGTVGCFAVCRPSRRRSRTC